MSADDLDNASLTARHCASQAALAWGAIDYLAARPPQSFDLTDLDRIGGHINAARSAANALIRWVAEERERLQTNQPKEK